MAIINDTDLLVVQKGGSNYTYSGAQLKDDMREFGSGGTAPTPSLAQVCSVGSDTSTNMGIGGALNVTGKVSCNGVQSGENITVAGTYTFNCVHAYGLKTGGTRRDLTVNNSGWFGGGDDITFRAAATNIQPIDTSNFIAALKAVNLHSSDQTIPETDRPFQVDPSLTIINDVGLFIDDIQATTASSFLLSNDDQGSFINNRRYSHFLFGVCKEQQELIESLTTRIEQLEADHASAMNNMEDDNGSSTY
jgi:hypothetical protein